MTKQYDGMTDHAKVRYFDRINLDSIIKDNILMSVRVRPVKNKFTKVNRCDTDKYYHFKSLVYVMAQDNFVKTVIKHHSEAWELY